MKQHGGGRHKESGVEGPFGYFFWGGGGGILTPLTTLCRPSIIETIQSAAVAVATARRSPLLL